jgi:hypothetical protein
MSQKKETQVNLPVKKVSYSLSDINPDFKEYFLGSVLNSIKPSSQSAEQPPSKLSLMRGKVHTGDNMRFIPKLAT